MSTAKITFWGAAGQVTGSMHLLEAAGARVLLDAGMFQGRRAEAAALNANLPFDPRRIDSIVVSHAHIDHIGRLPLLVRQGYHGPIYATPATRDLCAVMLPDAAHIQESDAAFLARHGKHNPASDPLYTMADALAVQDLMVGLPYKRIHYIRKNLAFEYTDAGHILGSASVDLRLSEAGNHRLVFSGDIGRSGLPIIRDPEPPAGPIDTLIVESTYGDRDHESTATSADRLTEIVRRVAGRGGKILIPAFALGRVQELVYALHQLANAGSIPALKIFVDSPLAVDATAVFRMHPEVFDRREQLVLSSDRIFDFPLLQYVKSVEDSKRLNTLIGPAIIIAASGMAESGRILHHLANHIGDSRNCVLLVGFQAEHTLGRRIEEGAKQVKIFGELRDVRAEVETVSGYSAHADRTELRAWVKALGGAVKRAFVVHGEAAPAAAMAQILKDEGVRNIVVPQLGESFDL
ncbi:MAG TPA: MBL fold metallo-hydrolase [Gemmatimonadales bacterium]|jgi:metallo-beta-lactamase family protein|nr:MBL fold metallo-hydrolase [Gemmatimonadales bacterium]